MVVLRSANFTCKYCGFVSRPSQKIPHGYMVPVDLAQSGLAATRAKGSICLCPICASALSINWSVAERKADHGQILPVAGNLIWLPEMSQETISLVAAMTLVGINDLDVGHELAKTFKDTDLSFRIRKAFLANNIPLYKNDKDSDFARALSLLPVEHYVYREEVLRGVRFWPNASFWKKQSRYWFHSTFKPAEDSLKKNKGV